jgi:hypothetical protein
VKSTTLYKCIGANDPHFVDRDELNRMVKTASLELRQKKSYSHFTFPPQKMHFPSFVRKGFQAINTGA